MMRYFFDFDDGRRQLRDDDGSEMPDLQASQDEAVDFLFEILRCKLRGEERRDFTATVRDEAGHIVFRATLSLVTERLH